MLSGNQPEPRGAGSDGLELGRFPLEKQKCFSSGKRSAPDSSSPRSKKLDRALAGRTANRLETLKNFLFRRRSHRRAGNQLFFLASLDAPHWSCKRARDE